MYLASAVIRRFEAEGRPKEDLPFFHWSMQYAMKQIQDAFDGLFANLEAPGLTWLIRGPIAWWSRLNPIGTGPSDRLGHKVAQLMQIPGEQRERLARGGYVPADPNEALGRLERAFRLTAEAHEVERKLRDAVKAKQLEKAAPAKLVAQALKKGIIDKKEAELLRKAEEARQDAIQVDAFTLEEYMRTALRREVSGGDGAGSETAPTPGGTPVTA